MTSVLSVLRTRWGGAPGTLRLVAGLLAVQTLGFVSFGAYELGQLQAGRVVSGLVTALLLVAWGVALAFGAYALLAGRVAARGPVLAAQLIQVPTAWSFRGGETTWVMVVLGLTSLLVLVLVLLPVSTRYLVGSRVPRRP
ncbi:hypothetical protein [Raineyella sp. LH-20]|uniref:hypothetical protein n=1 Tax=Raineyella sp. LH-20 TaxID=3081204 RepID=UPI002954AB03|nr:hypothetical protein [Raineyella sp. LH-20]WOP17908.1 hypothetical protein R0146_11745 [Raineyella sp. LH-20]